MSKYMVIFLMEYSHLAFVCRIDHKYRVGNRYFQSRRFHKAFILPLIFFISSYKQIKSYI